MSGSRRRRRPGGKPDRSPSAEPPPARGFAEILAPRVRDAMAAAALEREIDVDELADDLVRQLFTNGQGNQAARLMLVDADGRELAGWGPGPVRAHVLEALRKATRTPTLLEAVADDSIPRLALALRALSRDIEWDNDPSVYSLIWKLADYLDDPEAARHAITSADERNRRMRRIR